MAQSKKAKSTKSASTATNVTRVRATDTGGSDSKKKKPAKSTKVNSTETKSKSDSNVAPVKSAEKSSRKKLRLGILLRPFTAFGGYVKGAWFELKQVRWPTRRATWSLTGAVLLYTAFFTVLILMLDAAFKYIFEIILGQ